MVVSQNRGTPYPCDHPLGIFHKTIQLSPNAPHLLGAPWSPLCHRASAASAWEALRERAFSHQIFRCLVYVRP